MSRRAVRARRRQTENASDPAAPRRQPASPAPALPRDESHVPARARCLATANCADLPAWRRSTPPAPAPSANDTVRRNIQLTAPRHRHDRAAPAPRAETRSGDDRDRRENGRQSPPGADRGWWPPVPARQPSGCDRRPRVGYRHTAIRAAAWPAAPATARQSHQETGSRYRPFQTCRAVADSPVNALHMSEQLAFGHALQRRTVQIDQRIGRPRRPLVDRFRHQLFAGACFAANQHVQIRRGDDINLFFSCCIGADRPIISGGRGV